MQIPRSYIENYSRALNVVSERARAALVDALSQIDYTADIADIRNAVIAIMQPACGASSTMAARLAADFYDGLRARFGIDDGYLAQVDSMRDPEATSGAVRAFVQDLVDDKPIEQFVGKCVDRLDYETRKAANECIATNAKNDPEKPRWARVPTGVETCQFCIMLASRGFVYHSEETASHAHANCDCRVIPSWDKSPTAQGYDPDLYYDMWRHPEKYSEQTVKEEKPKIELKSIEASQYPDKFTNTKGKRQNFEAYIDAINSVEDADPKVREIFSRVGEIANSPNLPEAFDVKYAAGRGCVSTYYDRFTDEIKKVTVSVPKMTPENIKGTVSTTTHELGHFIDLMKGESGGKWMSTKYAGFLRADYLSLPPSERRAAAAARSEKTKPKGEILEVMREAEKRYKAAVENVKQWHKTEYERMENEYNNIENKTLEDRKQNLKDYKKLRREYDTRYDIECRIAMNGVDKLEDIYDALNDGYLRGKVIDGVEIRYGHGDSYYRSRDKQVEEIWANYCALSLTRPDLIELLRQDQPELVKSMDAMRDEILGGLNG
jgi:hypothetical protein